MSWALYTKLTAQRRAFEVAAALFALWLGIGTWGDYAQGAAPFAWTGKAIEAQLCAAQILTFAGIIHAVGMGLDGRWPISEILRISGLAMMTGVFFWLCYHGAGASAARTYFAIGLGTCFGMIGAVRDLHAARVVRDGDA